MNAARPTKRKATQAAKARAVPPAVPHVAPSSGRVDLVDAARGFAIAMMIAYHFCFDLTFFGWAQWPMLVDPRWIAWRSAIVTSFLFLAGISLALRDARERAVADPSRSQRAFVKRWAQIAGAAVLVTAGSMLLFPQSFIYFGVLHFVAVALWVCRRAPRLGLGSIALGTFAVGLGLGIAIEAMDPRVVNWIGFAAHKPITEDYVPLFPWLGVVLIGCGAGGLWLARECRVIPSIAALGRLVPSPIARTLAFAGRWSLTCYLVHQPILMGILAGIRQLS